MCDLNGVPPRTELHILIRGFIGTLAGRLETLAVILYSLSLRDIPACDVNAIYFTSSIFTMIFTVLFLHEPVTRTRGDCRLPVHPWRIDRSALRHTRIHTCEPHFKHTPCDRIRTCYVCVRPVSAGVHHSGKKHV